MVLLLYSFPHMVALFPTPRIAALSGLAFFLLFATATKAAGFITIDSIQNPIRHDTLYVHTKAKIVLPFWAEKLLREETPLEFVLDIEIREHREWLLDKMLVNISIKRHLKYQPGTESYLVENLPDGSQALFKRLASALAYLGNYRDIPAISEEIARSLEKPYVGVRVTVPRMNLPLGAQLESLISGNFLLSSGWYIKDLK